MAEDPRDPRYRPYRTLAWGVYLTVAIGFSLMITVSVTRSVATMTPGRPAFTSEIAPAAECIAGARALFEELDRHRKELSKEGRTRDADLTWAQFRLDWLTRMRHLEARCGVDEPGRQALKNAFSRLDHLLDLYTTHTIQFAGEVGPALDALKQALDAAKP